MWEWAYGGVSIHEFCSAVTRVLLRSMIITVYLFRSFLKPYFLYKNTKSMLLLSRMPNKSKNTTMNIHFWHKCIISSVFPLEYGLIQAGGSPLCTGVCCRLHEYLHSRHEYGDLKNTDLVGRVSVWVRHAFARFRLKSECHLSVNNVARNSQSDYPRLAIRKKEKKLQSNRWHFSLIKSDRG